MAEQDIADLIATSDGDTTWGDDMRGAMTTLKQRRGSIAQNATHYIDQYGMGGYQSSANSTGVANEWWMYPFFPDRDVTIDTIGVEVTTGVASAEVKITIYSATTTGWPDTRLYESTAIAAATSATFVSVAHSRTFYGGSVYWLGVRHSSTSTLKGVDAGYSGTLGNYSGQWGQRQGCLKRTLTFATAATDPYAFVLADVNTDNNVSIRMRVA